MKTRYIYGVAAALALSAAVTLFGQGQPPAGGGQAPPPEGSGRGAGRGAGGAQAPGGGGGGRGATSLRPKALDTTPDIPYEVVPNFMKLPPNVYMGEGIGVATNSKGHIFVNTCAQQTRNFEFDQNGNYVKEIGKNLYGNVFCHGIRVDPQDNIWISDEGANSIIRFNPEGTRVTMVIGGRAEFPFSGLQPPAKAADPAPHYAFTRPTDVAFDSQGNIFVTDGYVNSRVVKFDKNGRFVKDAGHRGTGPNEMILPHTLVVDHQGNVYVGSRSGQQILVYDNDLNYKRTFDTFGAPWSMCITDGPHQYIYTSNSNPDSNDSEVHKVTGQVFKIELDGTPVGKWGKPGKQQGEFSTVHGLDCRNENVIYTTEIVEWRLQKFLLHPAGARGGN
jgi:sugar lactone lactonase YvrE